MGRRGSGQTVTPGSNATVQLQQQIQQQTLSTNKGVATQKINLMNYGNNAAPIQFSQQLYQQHNQRQTAVNTQLLQQRQAMIAAQKQQQQQAMNNIWQQNQNKQPQHVQPQDFRNRQQSQQHSWNSVNVPQPGAQRAFNAEWQQSQRWNNQQHKNHQQQRWQQQQPGAPRNQWPPSPHNWNPNGQY